MSKTFHDLPVVEFEVGMDITGIDPSAVAWRIDAHDPKYDDYEIDRDSFDRRLDELVAAPWAGDITALIVGDWGVGEGDIAPIDELVAAADRLTRLTGLYLGDIDRGQSEISWIELDYVCAIPRAYPQLRQLWVRGERPDFEHGTYPVLEDLRLESAGIPSSTVRAAGESSFPALTHLELWLGVNRRGGNATVDDLAPILAGTRLPALTTLGLRNSEIADQIAAALAGAPIVAQLSTLDLSMGMLSDTGAAALLAGQPLTHLTRLNLSHHYLSEDMMRRVRDELEPHGVDVDLSWARDPGIDPEDRYVAVQE